MAYTTINKSTEHFNTKLYTGTGSSNAITGVGFQPDWVWAKRYDGGTNNHRMANAVSGSSELQSSNITNVGADSSYFSSFNSDGFTVGTASDTNVNSGSFVSWNWKAGGTAPSKTYVVKVVSDSGNKYRFDDFGTSAVTLDLQEGGTYTFDQSDSSNATHPLRFYTAADKTGGEYTTGVTTNGTPGSSGAYTRITVAASAPTLYYQCSAHAGMGGQVNTNSLFGSSNFSGSIQSTVSVNTTAGFSIVKWTGNGSGSTIGHGLDVKPKMIFVKNISSARNWVVNIGETIGTDERSLYLNASDAMKSDAAADHGYTYNNTTTTFQTSGGSGGTQDDVNKNGDTIIAYCFGEKTGYSKFGSYTGNGESNNGPYIYTGFRPSFLMIKCTSHSSSWDISDDKRLGYNPKNYRLTPHNTAAQYTGVEIYKDYVSNGFKIRASDTDTNGNGRTYIYMALGQTMVGSNDIPATAR